MKLASSICKEISWDGMSHETLGDGSVGNTCTAEGGHQSSFSASPTDWEILGGPFSFFKLKDPDSRPIGMEPSALSSLIIIIPSNSLL